MVSFGVMSLVMTAAPLAMVGCGLGEDNAALGIQWHVMAMFGPSFVTGSLIARFGKEPIMIVGLALLLACGIVGLSGSISASSGRRSSSSASDGISGSSGRRPC